MPKISVIVPVYNVGRYVEKTIKSILRQTFEDFELILVDDGSTDNSGKICDEYSEKDNRIRVIHKENEGVSSARNTGLDEALGEYIGFVDGDDCIAGDMYEMLYNDIVKNNADIAICGICNYFKGGRRTRQSNINGFWKFNNVEALKEVLEDRLFSVNPVNKLYKKELFDNLRYPAGRIAEDAFLTPLLMIRAKKVVYNSKPKYICIHRGDSITTSYFKKSDFDVVDAYDKHLEIVRKFYPELESQAMFRHLWSYMYVFDKIIMSNDLSLQDEYNKVLLIIRKNTFKILSNKHFSLKRKLATIVLLFSPKAYEKLTVKNKGRNFRLFDAVKK